jgi:hypothetical protein
MKNGAEGDSPRPLMDMHAPRPEGSSLTARPMRTHSVHREKGSRTSSPARDLALEEANTVCVDTMLTRARLGLTPTEDAKEELRKYQQLHQKVNEEYNAEACKESSADWLGRRTTEKHKDPMLGGAEVTYSEMCSMHHERGIGVLATPTSLRDYWETLPVVKEDTLTEQTTEYAKVSFAAMRAMFQYRGIDLSETQMKDQWNYLKEVEGYEVQEKPMLCAQGCGQPVCPRNKKFLSQEAQNKLLMRSCCSPCWMKAHFPKDYINLGWNLREHDHGGACLKALLNEA